MNIIAPVDTAADTAKPVRRPKAPPLPVLAKIDTDIIVIDPNYYFTKPYDDIREAVSELPLIIEYINESLQRAVIAHLDAKEDLAAHEGEIYARVRQEWASTYSEKMTVESVKMAVDQDKDLLDAKKNFSVLKSYVGRLSNLQENLRTKLDALRSVEATRRKLINDDPEQNR